VQANYLKHGDGKRVNSLTREQQDSLWDGIMKSEHLTLSPPPSPILSQLKPCVSVRVRVCADNFKRFWDVNDLLFPQDKQAIKYLPVRIVRKDRPVMQEPVMAYDSEGTPPHLHIRIPCEIFEAYACRELLCRGE
jgi:hypothetical protein